MASRAPQPTPNPQSPTPAWRQAVAEAEALANEKAAQAAGGDNTVATVEGVLERITYSNGENG